MPDLPNSIARRALAAELRRLREHMGISGDEAASRLGWSGSKVSRLETHRTGVKPDDLEHLLSLYSVDEDQRGKLRALATEQGRRGWWSAYANALSPDFVAYLELEAAARSVSCWSPEIIHGLLQTADYAWAALEVSSGLRSNDPPGLKKRIVDARLRRQEILTQSDTKRFTFVLDEAALRHRYADAAVMRRELMHIADVGDQPHVQIRVLDFAAPHPIGPGGFALLEFSPVYDTTLNDVVYMEHLTRNSFVEDEDETYDYRLAFDRLLNNALGERASRDLILKIVRELWS